MQDVSGGMHQPTSQTSQYVITAWTPSGVIQQTRSEAAGAVVLALTLRAAGHSVDVLDPMGNLVSSDRAADGGAKQNRAQTHSLQA